MNIIKIIIRVKKIVLSCMTFCFFEKKYIMCIKYSSSGCEVFVSENEKLFWIRALNIVK